MVLTEPHGVFRGTVFTHEPVVVVEQAEGGRWVRLVTDTGFRGWVRTRILEHPSLARVPSR